MLVRKEVIQTRILVSIPSSSQQQYVLFNPVTAFRLFGQPVSRQKASPSARSTVELLDILTPHTSIRFFTSFEWLAD